MGTSCCGQRGQPLSSDSCGPTLWRAESVDVGLVVGPPAGGDAFGERGCGEAEPGGARQRGGEGRLSARLDGANGARPAALGVGGGTRGPW